jgi:hypothetical protein
MAQNRLAQRVRIHTKLAALVQSTEGGNLLVSLSLVDTQGSLKALTGLRQVDLVD